MKIKGILIIFTLALLLASFASAAIVITQQPEDSYSMGDTITIPVKIKSVSGVNNFFLMELFCNGQQTEVHKEFVSLLPGDEKEMFPTVPLVQSFTGKSTGSCSLKAILDDEFILTNDFEISNEIIITVTEGETSFKPGESIIIEGDAIKSNGDFVNGFLDITLTNENLGEAVSISDTVKNGFFFVNFSLPEDTKSGTYSVNLNIYEKDFQDAITNTGSGYHNIEIAQVATNLEIFFENAEVEPGTNLQVKAILHDQTGESMRETATIIIEDEVGNLLEQVDHPTDEIFEFAIKYNQAPAKWHVNAKAGKLDAESSFNILIKEAVSVELSNQTVFIINAGNVPYNKTVLVKIGGETVSIATDLGIDEEQKYILTAPDGEYPIHITTDEGTSLKSSAILTGKAIDVRKAGLRVGRIFTNPIVWIFIIIILAFVAFMIFRKGFKRSFFGRGSKKLDEETEYKPIALNKKSLIKSMSPAVLSLSIKGEKQNAEIVTLKVKNLHELQEKKTSASDVLQKIVDFAEGKKASTYENYDDIFFILSPAKTRTFKNEKTALSIASGIKSMLENHNKLAKQKISFGLALTSGSIVAKKEENSLKFMSMGTLVTSSKKIASLSTGEILLDKKFKEKAAVNLKVEKMNKQGVEVYLIKEIKKVDPDAKKFIHQFVEKYERENKK